MLAQVVADAHAISGADTDVVSSTGTHVEQASNAAKAQSPDAVAPVKLDLYMEALCPFCGRFLTQEASHMFETGLGSIMDFSVIPWVRYLHSLAQQCAAWMTVTLKCQAHATFGQRKQRRLHACTLLCWQLPSADRCSCSRRQRSTSVVPWTWQETRGTAACWHLICTALKCPLHQVARLGPQHCAAFATVSIPRHQSM